jgi:hypothetical protein
MEYPIKSNTKYQYKQRASLITTADRVPIDTGRSIAHRSREPNTADIKLINSTLTTSAQAPVEPTKYPQRKDENPFLTQAKRAEVTTFVMSSLVVVLCFLGFFIYYLASYIAYGVGGVFASFCIWRTLQLLVELEEEIHYSSISNFLRYFSLNTILACMCTAAIVTGLAGFWTKYQRGARSHNDEKKESITRTVGSVCHPSPMTYKETNHSTTKSFTFNIVMYHSTTKSFTFLTQKWTYIVKDIKRIASAGNRTRVTSMATRYSTTRPQML